MTRRALLLVLWPALPAAGANFHVAVFNFQMKSDTPEWAWQEKGLADQITTDVAQSRRGSRRCGGRAMPALWRFTWALETAWPRRYHARNAKRGEYRPGGPADRRV
jgi:hypothetical protein